MDLITLIGFGSESVFSHTVQKFQGDPSASIVDLEQFVYSGFNCFRDDKWDLRIEGVRSCTIELDAPIYHRFFPRREADRDAQERVASLYKKFVSFCMDRRPGTLLINHPHSSSMNASKVAQIDLLRTFGFHTPATTLSTSKSNLREFCALYERPISKGCSGVRTMAKRVDPDEIAMVGDHQHVPILLQEYIEGYDVRLHCVGLSRIALKIETDFDDYRYAEKNGHSLAMALTEVPPEVTDKCWDYMRHEGQEFAAFDFRVRNDHWYLLEVNPMPGYSFFDNRCGGLISDALTSLLRQGYSNLYRPNIAGTFIPLARRPQVDIGNVKS